MTEQSDATDRQAAEPQALLVRHCETTGQAPGAPLTEAGHRQAEGLAESLGNQPIDFVVTSPYRRARESIEPFAARRSLAIHEDPRLVERTLSPTPIDDWRDYVRRSFDDPHLRAPGGESGHETLTRGMAAVNAVLALDHGLPVIVTHGLLLSLVIDAIRPGFGYAGWASLGNPDVFRIWGPPEGRRVERWSP